MSQTVYVKSYTGAGRDTYHTDPDCNSLQSAKTVLEWDKETAETKQLELCKRCAGEVTYSKRDLSYINSLRQAAGD